MSKNADRVKFCSWSRRDHLHYGFHTAATHLTSEHEKAQPFYASAEATRDQRGLPLSIKDADSATCARAAASDSRCRLQAKAILESDA